MLFLNNVDLNGNQLLNALIQLLSADPSSPSEGRLYYNSTAHVLKYYNGSAWVTPAGGTVTSFSAGNLSPLFTSSVATPTSTPALTFTLTNQNANLVYAGPSSGGAAAPTFRALVAADLPSLDALTAPAADVSLNSHKITNLATPTANADAATKAYVDGIAQGIVWKPTAAVATTAALPAVTYANGTSGVGATLTASANGALTVDSYAVAAGDRILVKNQASGLQNGLYDVTQPGTGAAPFILTRNVNMDTAAEFAGAGVIVEDAGTTNANSLWVCTNSANPTVGTTAIVFAELNKAADLTAGTGITISGNTVSVATTYAGGTSIATLGTVTTGTWNASVIGSAYGGAGAVNGILKANGSGTVSAAAVADIRAAGGTGKYSATIGDGSTTAIAVTQATHGLASNGQMIAMCFDATSGALVQPDITVANGTGTVTFTFAVAPTTNQYRIVIIG